ncbi:hypothetical protein H8M03_11380 [Sphingomonas sabuli]|uniref:Porin domain-containing protein n=1 Tax=Sphingomonas sabuli TaxID=2764186 RepID=A0A7G9L1T9_9SPHN|nr:hypothetical protein [Sphingomonas sabuli]QNM82588.1 hypothetical protein H8M03_11380 [Sphingomonas sabuli]
MWDLPPVDPAFEISVASRGMSKGIAQTDGVQVLPKASLKLGDVQVGAQWKNVTSPVADGEAALFVNVGRQVAGFQVGGGIAYKFQTNVKEPTDDTSWEFSANASRKFGRISGRMSAVYSPDDLGGGRRSLYLDGGPTFDIDKATKLSANLGHRSRVNGVDYTSFNAGVTRSFKALSLDLRYYDTNRGEAGENYGERVVLLGRLSF